MAGRHCWCTALPAKLLYLFRDGGGIGGINPFEAQQVAAVAAKWLVLGMGVKGRGIGGQPWLG
jgi:hypothetical protein